jgi:hypothetical protein
MVMAAGVMDIESVRRAIAVMLMAMDMVLRRFRTRHAAVAEAIGAESYPNTATS